MMPSTWSQGMGRHEEEKILREIELPSRWADTTLRKRARSLGPTPHSCPAWSSGFRSLVLVDEEYGLSLGESHTSYAGSSCSAEPDFFSTETWFSDRQDGTIKTHWEKLYFNPPISVPFVLQFSANYLYLLFIQHISHPILIHPALSARSEGLFYFFHEAPVLPQRWPSNKLPGCTVRAFNSKPPHCTLSAKAPGPRCVHLMRPSSAGSCTHAGDRRRRFT